MGKGMVLTVACTAVSLLAGNLMAAEAPAKDSKISASEKIIQTALKKNVMPGGAWSTSYTTIFNEFEAADIAADEAWRQLKTRAEYDAYREKMHQRMVKAVGGFPEKTPLNAKVIQTVPRDGYKIEKILLESMPGVYVTALLYLPDSEKFKAPYPAYLIACGHSGNGKGSAGYQRGCVLGALQGFAACIYDPISQGERTQIPTTTNCAGHNRLGVLAALVGRSMAQFRIWDGIRMIDYLKSRPDIQKDRMGLMGNSGGGTMTSLIMAIDPRVTAAAPSCYISSLREVCGRIGPQDAEQNIFNQLSFGLNHAGYVLLQGQPVRLHCCHNDFFPFCGSRETFKTVECVVKNIGLDPDRYGMTDVPGPHGWKESTRTSSVIWMRRWLKDDKKALPIDVTACRRLDLGFSDGKVDSGLKSPDYNVTPEGKVSKLPGFRSVYEYLKDDLNAALKNRKPLSQNEQSAVVRKCALIGDLQKPAYFETEKEKKGDFTIIRQIFNFSNGLSLPAVTISKEGASKEPILLVGDQKRQNFSALTLKWVDAGHPVMVADLIGNGEIHRMRHRFYGSKNADEELGVLLYKMGKSLIGVRAGEILSLCDSILTRSGQAPRIVAKGHMAIPAAHAYAADRKIAAGVEVVDPPASWTEAIQKSLVYSYVDIINGAALEYDWIDLLN